MTITLNDVISTLTNGKRLTWTTGGEKQEILLASERAGRLVRVLIDGAYNKLDVETGSAKEKTLAEEQLFQSLDAAWVAPLPAEGHLGGMPPEQSELDFGPWMLERVETEGFGGINGEAATEKFELGIMDGSICLVGGNGSGKSSLISAIAWALTGQRINDYTGLSEDANSLSPVFDPASPETVIGSWAPIATYPSDRTRYAAMANVRVALTFRKAGGSQTAIIERTWTSKSAPDTTVTWPSELDAIKRCIDVAVEMPLRMAHLRLGRESTLSEAISQLMGLDVLTTVGQLIPNLKLKTGRYLNTPKQAEHDQQLKDIERDLDKAAENQSGIRLRLLALKAVGDFASNPAEYEAAAVALIDELVTKAGGDLAALAAFVAPSVDLNSDVGQKQIGVSVSAAHSAYDATHLSDVMKASCKSLTAFSQVSANRDERVAAANQIFEEYSKKLTETADIHRRKLADARLALKAAAAQTHGSLHGAAPVVDCPLCERDLTKTGLATLAAEIDGLRLEGELIAQSLTATCSQLSSACLAELRKLGGPLVGESDGPTERICAELRSLLVGTHAFAKAIPEFGRVFEAAWQEMKDDSRLKFNVSETARAATTLGFEEADQAALDGVWNEILKVRKYIDHVSWSHDGVAAFRDFYSHVLGKDPEDGGPADVGTLRGLVSHLQKIVDQAKPFREAIEAITHAKQLAAIWLPNEATKKLRKAVCEAIDPLKALPKFVEAEIDGQLKSLSGLIRNKASRFHTSAKYTFSGARLEREAKRRKSDLKARAVPRMPVGKPATIEIDSGLVANSSWMRALLWSFLFSIREDRASQLGVLPLPLMLMDDPQATFDFEHRCAWVDIVLNSHLDESLKPVPQAIFATHDESFAMQLGLQLGKFPVSYIATAETPEASVFVSGTVLIDRVWEVAKSKRTNEASTKAIGEMRKHLESMMKVIFPREMGATKSTLGELMSEFSGRLNANTFPYDHPEFRRLVSAWSDPSKEAFRKALSVPHHDISQSYDFNFAERLFDWCLGKLYREFATASILYGVHEKVVGSFHMSKLPSPSLRSHLMLVKRCRCLQTLILWLDASLPRRMAGGLKTLGSLVSS